MFSTTWSVTTAHLLCLSLITEQKCWPSLLTPFIFLQPLITVSVLYGASCCKFYYKQNHLECLCVTLRRIYGQKYYIIFIIKLSLHFHVLLWLHGLPGFLPWSRDTDTITLGYCCDRVVTCATLARTGCSTLPLWPWTDKQYVQNELAKSALPHFYSAQSTDKPNTGSGDGLLTFYVTWGATVASPTRLEKDVWGESSPSHCNLQPNC